jgi:hypothetical protein
MGKTEAVWCFEDLGRLGLAMKIDSKMGYRSNKGFGFDIYREFY